MRKLIEYIVAGVVITIAYIVSSALIAAVIKLVDHDKDVSWIPVAIIMALAGLTFASFKRA